MYIHIYTHIYTRDGNPRQPQHKHKKAEPQRNRYDWLTSEYGERASQSQRALQNPTSMHPCQGHPKSTVFSLSFSFSLSLSLSFSFSLYISLS